MSLGSIEATYGSVAEYNRQQDEKYNDKETALPDFDKYYYECLDKKIDILQNQLEELEAVKDRINYNYNITYIENPYMPEEQQRHIDTDRDFNIERINRLLDNVSNELDKTIDRLVNSANVKDRVYAAHKGFCLDTLLKDKSIDVRVAVAEEGQFHNILVKDKSTEVRAAVGRTTGDDAILSQLANDDDIRVRSFALKSNNRQIIEMLSNDDAPYIRQSAASKIKAAEAWNKTMVNAGNYGKITYQGRPIEALDEKTQNYIYKSYDLNLIDKWIKSDNKNDRLTVARTGFGIEKLVTDPDWEIRFEVANQKYGLNKLVADPDERVRAEVAFRGDNDLRFRLSYDTSPVVQDMLKEVGYTSDLDKLITIANSSGWNVFKSLCANEDGTIPPHTVLDFINDNENIRFSVTLLDPSQEIDFINVDDYDGDTSSLYIENNTIPVFYDEDDVIFNLIDDIQSMAEKNKALQNNIKPVRDLYETLKSAYQNGFDNVTSNRLEYHQNTDTKFVLATPKGTFINDLNVLYDFYDSGKAAFLKAHPQISEEQYDDTVEVVYSVPPFDYMSDDIINVCQSYAPISSSPDFNKESNATFASIEYGLLRIEIQQEDKKDAEVTAEDYDDNPLYIEDKSMGDWIYCANVYLGRCAGNDMTAEDELVTAIPLIARRGEFDIPENKDSIKAAFNNEIFKETLRREYSMQEDVHDYAVKNENEEQPLRGAAVLNAHPKDKSAKSPNKGEER